MSVAEHLPLRFMGRTLTATFTFVSDIFVHFSLPPCLSAALSMYSPWILDKKSGFQASSSTTKRVQTPRRRNGHIFLSLYPPVFAFRASPVHCSSPRQHPHRHLRLGARLLSSGRLKTAVPQRGNGFTHRTAPRTGGENQEEKCDAAWPNDKQPLSV